MGDVDLCADAKYEGVRRPSRHGRLDHVARAEHPRHRASTRTGRLTGRPADHRAGGTEQDRAVASSGQQERPERCVFHRCLTSLAATAPPRIAAAAVIAQA